MHVFLDRFGGDYIIAQDIMDAGQVWQEKVGTDVSRREFLQLPDTQFLHIHDEGGRSQELTCAEWVAMKGRGWLCEEDYFRNLRIPAEENVGTGPNTDTPEQLEKATILLQEMNRLLWDHIIAVRKGNTKRKELIEELERLLDDLES